MSSIGPELSSISATVNAVRERVGGLLVGLGPSTEDLAAALVEAERALLSATRQLDRAQRLSR